MGKVTCELKRSIIGEQTTIDQQDPIDPSLIVKSSWVSQPLKQVQGVDYPETVGNTIEFQLKYGAKPWRLAMSVYAGWLLSL